MKKTIAITSTLGKQLTRMKEKEQTQLLNQLYAFRGEYAEALINDPKNAIRELMLTLDEVILKAQQADDENQISCKKGCDACCTFRVSCYIEEALMLYSRGEFSSSFWDKAKKVANIDSDKQWLDMPTDLRRCLFLDNHQCSVYHLRPLVCRSYFVVNDPQVCSKYDSTISQWSPLFVTAVENIIIRPEASAENIAKQLLKIKEIDDEYRTGTRSNNYPASKKDEQIIRTFLQQMRTTNKGEAEV